MREVPPGQVPISGNTWWPGLRVVQYSRQGLPAFMDMGGKDRSNDHGEELIRAR